jgi:hypothetical protein
MSVEESVEPLEAGYKLVAGGVQLRDQVNKRWDGRDKSSDGWIGDTDHQSRVSDHNPDRRGIVHAIDIDEDFRGSTNDNRWFADQLIAYARGKNPGWARLKYVVYENQVASGTYASQNWVWRDGDYGHEHHIHVSFTKIGETDYAEFKIPILYGTSGVWDGVTPYYDYLANAIKQGSATKATWRLACRLHELGFYEGQPQPVGKQKYPAKAIRNMQDYMGWARRDYDPKTHKAIWKAFRLSDPNGE